MNETDPKKIFKKYCRKNMLRYTPKRALIIDEIYTQYDHFNIDNLYLRIRNRHPNIKLSKASIYRTLPHLIKAGLLRTSFNKEGHICYEQSLGHAHHDHLQCLGCGKVFDFQEDEIDRIQEIVCRRYKFKIVSHEHVVNGFCSECRKKQKAKRKN